MNPAYASITRHQDVDLTVDDFIDYALYQNLDIPIPGDLLRKIVELKTRLELIGNKEQRNRYSSTWRR